MKLETCGRLRHKGIDNKTVSLEELQNVWNSLRLTNKLVDKF